MSEIMPNKIWASQGQLCWEIIQTQPNMEEFIKINMHQAALSVMAAAEAVIEKAELALKTCTNDGYDIDYDCDKTAEALAEIAAYKNGRER